MKKQFKFGKLVTKSTYRTIALLMIFIMIASAGYPNALTVRAESLEEEINWEDRLDTIDAIYTDPEQSPPDNIYIDDGFDNNKVQELLLTEPYKNFLRTSDHEIVDKFGNPYLIKSMTFDNDVWFSYSYGNYSPYIEDTIDPLTGEIVTHSKKSHSKDSYAQIKEMGYNSVRFYMHLNWFNNLYKTDTNGNILMNDGEKVINWENPGLNWIRKNVLWAEENDIKLILNMHLYQSQIWERQKDTVLPDNENGKREVMNYISTALRAAFGWDKYFTTATDEDFFNALCEKYNQSLAERAKFDLGDIGLESMPKNSENEYTYNVAQILELEYRVNRLTCEKFRKQLINAWTVIGKMLRSQDAVIGYGLLNEPIPSIQFSQDQNGNYIVDEDATSGQWEDLAQSIADSVRTEDQNHILFVERLQNLENNTRGIKLNENTYNIYSRIADDIEIEDDNYAYEIHSYVPYFLSHIPCSDYKINDKELGDYYGYIKGNFDSGIQELKYPNDTIVEYYQIEGLQHIEVPIKKGNTNINENALLIEVGGSKKNVWQRYNSDHSIEYHVNTATEVDGSLEPNVAVILFTVENLGGTQNGRGYVLFDNLVVKDRYVDANGNPQEDIIMTCSFGMAKEPYWSNNDDVGTKYHDTGGQKLKGREDNLDLTQYFPEGYPDLIDVDQKNGCFEVANRTGKNFLQINLKAFNPKPGHKYSVSADMKYENEAGNDNNAKACVELMFQNSPNAYTVGSDYIEYVLEDLMKIGTKVKEDAQGNITEVKRPVFLGECGMSNSSLTEYGLNDVGEGKTYATYNEKLLAINGSVPNANWIYNPVQIEGGLNVITDLFDVIDKYSKTDFPLGFNLHEYHSRTFGVYINTSTETPEYKKDMNRSLVKVFMEKLLGMGSLGYDYDILVLEKEDNKAWLNEKAGIYGSSLAETLQDGTDMISLRHVCETLGFSVVWNENESSVTVTNPSTGQFYKGFINSTGIVTNKGTSTMAKPIVVINQTIYAPAIEFLNMIGYKMETAVDTSQNKYFIIYNRKTEIDQTEMQDLIACKQEVSVLYNNSTMIPIRYIAENMGMVVGWDSINNKVTVDYIAEGINKKISFSINNTEVTVVDNVSNTTQTKYFSTAPFIKAGNNNTYVPINEFFSFMGIIPEYVVDLNKNAYITYGGNRISLEYQ